MLILIIQSKDNANNINSVNYTTSHNLNEIVSEYVYMLISTQVLNFR